jgi:hypothetical protein
MGNSWAVVIVLASAACADPAAEVAQSTAVVVIPGLRPAPLIAPDILYSSDGVDVTNHASISPTRASYDGRIALESETAAKLGQRCFRLIRPEVLAGHISGSTQQLATPLIERSCLPASVFHASTKPGKLGIQGAVCDASPGQPQGRVDPRLTNAQPTPCAGNPTADCYTLTAVTHFEPSDGTAPEFWSRQFTIVVSNPKTSAAHIDSVTALGVGPVGAAQPVGTSILEPAVSGDGRVLIYHDGRTIKYAVNPPGGLPPCDARGFNTGQPISSMFTDGNMAPYGVAKFQLRDSENNPILPGTEVGGAYPWIDRNAANLFMATAGSTLYYMDPTGVTVSSRYPVVGGGDPGSPPPPPPPATDDGIRLIGDTGGRSGLMVMGLWTEGKMVVLDSRLNNSDIAVQNASPQVNDRRIDLYSGGNTRIGASNNFFINSIENVLNTDPDLRPATPRDVVWQLSSTTGTEEVAFDDYLLKRALIFSPMNPSVNNTAMALHKRDYNDGFNATGTFRGDGFTLTPHIQNAATSVRWKVPAFGSLLGGARVEPIAAGGVRGKGVYLDGNDDHIDYVVPTQPQATDMASSPWMYSVWVNPRSGIATARRILQTPDTSELLLSATSVVIQRAGVTAPAIVIPAALAPSATHYTHLAVVSAPSGSGSKLTVYLDGFLLTSVTTSTTMLRMSAGTLTLGATAGHAGVIGWFDELKVIGQAPGPEELCNHAYGTLVGVTTGPGFTLANAYPSASHTAITALLGTGTTYPRYYCESQVLAGADAAGYACKTSRSDPRCVGQRVIFPEGPLRYGVPRPSSASNAFCLGCHDSTNPSPTLQTTALAFHAGLNLENDRRRQPMQPTTLLFGQVPADLFGPGLPMGPLPPPPGGLEVDAFLLP